MPVKEKQVQVKKAWGWELWLVNGDKYCGKLLLVDKGATCSYHCHHNKQETFFALQGQCMLTVEDKVYDLNPLARAKTIMPREFHKFKGLTKAVLLEVSTHHDDADVERREESIPAKKRSWDL
jgi:mannose-6-phosphate isomerase-like protein (cupin superfamily)